MATYDLPNMKSKKWIPLEEHEKEIRELSIKYSELLNDATRVSDAYKELKSKSVLIDDVKATLRNICKHKNINTKDCQICEVYFQLFELN